MSTPVAPQLVAAKCGATPWPVAARWAGGPQQPRERPSHRHRRNVSASAAPTKSLQRQFGGGGGAAAAAGAARKRLLEQLGSERPDTAAISKACDELVAAAVPFREADLGGGPWQVVYTRGPQLWQLWQGRMAQGGRVASLSRNRASQDFEPRTRRVVNYGELLGTAVTVSASGSYAPADDRTACPKLVRASIERGGLSAWGAEIPLPIKGSGLVYVAYLDSSLRIFRSTNGSISVQVRQSELERLLGGRRR